MTGTDKSETVAASRVRVDVAALTDIGKARDTNEDAYFVCRIGRFLERLSSNVSESLVPRVETSGYVMIVADGMGGHAAGEIASHTAIAATLQLILDSPKWSLKLDDPATREQEIGEIWQRAREFLAAIHAAVEKRAAADRALQGMGTTLTIAYSVGIDLFVVHVGDSRAYLFRDGVANKITRDHTLAQQYVDMGLVKPEEAEAGPFSHVLTRAVGGNQERPEADIESLQLLHGDRLLLCTDGLSNAVSEAEMAAVLGSGVSAAEACRGLVDKALAASGSDNITVVVADYAIDPA